jgi:small nuclear ribonucleoprotein G
VKLNGNRKVTGTLRGFDQFLNIVLDESVDGTTKESMGMVVIRGNSIMLLEPLERVF